MNINASPWTGGYTCKLKTRYRLLSLPGNKTSDASARRPHELRGQKKNYNAAVTWMGGRKNSIPALIISGTPA